MLHVKHGHVLVHGEVEPRARRALQQRLKLHDVEIVAGGDALEVVFAQEVGGGERIRDVELKIAAATITGEESEVVVIATEVAVGLARAHLFQDPLFAGFEDPRRGDPDGRRKLRAES